MLVIMRGIRYTERNFSHLGPRSYAIGITHALNGGLSNDGSCLLKKRPCSTPPSCFDNAKDALASEFSKYGPLTHIQIGLIALNTLYVRKMLRKTRTSPLTPDRFIPDNPVATFIEGGSDNPSAIMLRA